jgi:hypothetical protein
LTASCPKGAIPLLVPCSAEIGPLFAALFPLFGGAGDLIRKSLILR